MLHTKNVDVKVTVAQSVLKDSKVVSLEARAESQGIKIQTHLLLARSRAKQTFQSAVNEKKHGYCASR